MKPKKIYNKRVVTDLKQIMKARKITISMLADYSSVSERTIIKARAGEPILTHLAALIDGSLSRDFIKPRRLR